jgi:ligand-binding sensor domain-containing protein/signal transduction histidine kinase
MRPERSLYLAIWWLVLAVPLDALGERLPINVYTVDQGLAQSQIKQIVQDSRGFIWLTTGNGLSRFDGHRFHNFTIADGLPHRSINSLLETRKGEYWVATNGGGVARFNLIFDASGGPVLVAPATGGRFTVYPVGDNPASNRVNMLYEDRAGRVWAATDGGLFRLDEAGAKFEQVLIGTPRHPDRRILVWNFLEDREGSLWVGTSVGLVRRLPDGRVMRYEEAPDGVARQVSVMITDQEERLWVGYSNGLVVFYPQPARDVLANDRFPWREVVGGPQAKAGPPGAVSLPASPGPAHWFRKADGLSGDTITGLYRFPRGEIWISTSTGLSVFDQGKFRSYSTDHGLANNQIAQLMGDRAGYLWIGTATAGVMRLSRNGFLQYGMADGLGSDYVLWIGEDAAGQMYVATSQWMIHRFDGERFHAVRPFLPRHLTNSSRRWTHRMLLDHLGEWWVTTPDGVYRYPRVEHIDDLTRTPPKAVYTERDGLIDRAVNSFFEDAHGDLWFGSFLPDREVLTRWERATGKFKSYGEVDGLPAFHAFTACATDKEGGVWIGFRDGGLARFKDGRFTMLTEAEGLPSGDVAGLQPDRAGRLWAIVVPQIGWIDDLHAQRPRFRLSNTANAITGFVGGNAIAEDALGRLYFAPGRGVARLDPATGFVKHYVSADGATNLTVFTTYRDRHGTLWFGTENGLLRLIPQPDPPVVAPSVLISNLRVAGVDYGVSSVGATALRLNDLAPNQNNLAIEFLGLSFGSGEVMRFQYKLEGSDQDWTPPTDRRGVDYANLAPGDYRFLVRALSSDGLVSPTVASVTFSILPPYWRRLWFVALIAVTVAGAIYALERLRVSRLIELERVRMRIATDLHDDIGAGLSRIAILSEVGGQRLGTGDLRGREHMTVIAGASRELLDSMSDIVWAINPRKEHLKDLIQRMRRFASDLLSGRNIAFRFHAPEGEQDPRLGADLRRELFLIFKESINNLVRHSRATEVEIDLGIDRRTLSLRVQDNGRGFDPALNSQGESEGNGLRNMRARAVRLGGELEISSAPGEGTTVSLRVPLTRHSWFERSKPEDPRRRRH